MVINKIVCNRCLGHRRVFDSVEDACPQCKGKGYITYPTFTTEEAIRIAKYFGFDIEGDEGDLQND